MTVDAWDEFSTPAPAGPSSEWDEFSAPAPGAPPARTGWNVAEQAGLGTQSGLASMLGLPVDALAGAVNGVAGLFGAAPPMVEPVGGAASLNRLFGAYQEATGADQSGPQTAAERIARRVGEEVGAATPLAPLAVVGPAASAVTAARPGATLAVEGVGALGSGAAAGLANEASGGNPVVEALAQVVGGVTAGGLANRAFLPQAAKAPAASSADLLRDSDAMYRQVRADTSLLPAADLDAMAQDALGRLYDENFNPRLHPNVDKIATALMEDTADPMTLYRLDQSRRTLSSNLPQNASLDEQRLAGVLRSEIDDYISSLGTPTAATLQDARAAHRRGFAAQEIEKALDSKALAAASTGTGGNGINAARQALKGILTTPRKARSFSPAEREVMRAIVEGTRASNIARYGSRMAPSSGGLAGMLQGGGVLAGITTGNPLWALPAVMGEASKAAGEALTRRQLDALMRMMTGATPIPAPGSPLGAGRQGTEAVLRALALEGDS